MLEMKSVLEDCLADIRAGRRDVHACATAYPELADELEELLPLALAIHPLPVSPDPHRKLLARQAFVEEIHRNRGSAGPWAALLGLLRLAPLRPVPLLLNLIVIAAVVGSTSMAVRASQPGDLLYGLKTQLEQVQVATAATPDAKAEVRLDIAAERLQEVQSALASNRPQAASSAATAYAGEMDHARQDIQVAVARGLSTDGIRKKVQTTMVRQQEVLAQASVKGATDAANVIQEVQMHRIELRPFRATPETPHLRAWTAAAAALRSASGPTDGDRLPSRCSALHNRCPTKVPTRR